MKAKIPKKIKLGLTLRSHHIAELKNLNFVKSQILKRVKIFLRKFC